MLNSSTAEPQKTTSRPLYSIFTSSPISTNFKRPIFKDKTPSTPSQQLEIPSHFEEKENQPISSLPLKSDALSFKQGSANTSSENIVQPCSLARESSTVKTPPSCESERPSADNSDDDDQTVFFTPELFEGEGSPQKEAEEESPQRVVLEAESPPPLSEELLGSEQAQGQGSAFDGQSAISVSKQITELSQGQNEEIRGQKQGEEGEEGETQSWQTGSKLCRLSRSRQKAPCAPTGK